MRELEIAFVGLLILLGVAAIVYAGTRPAGRKSDKTAASGDAGAPIMAGKHDNPTGHGDVSGGDGGGGGDGGAV